MVSHIKINSKWITGLNINPQIIKLLEESVRENLYELILGKDFLNTTPKTTCKESIDKTNFIKSLTFKRQC